MNAKGSALAPPSPDSQLKLDSQTVGAVVAALLINVRLADVAASVRVLSAPPPSGLKLSLRLTGLAVGPWTRPRVPVPSGAYTLLSGTRCTKVRALHSPLVPPPTRRPGKVLRTLDWASTTAPERLDNSKTDVVAMRVVFRERGRMEL